MYRIYCRVSTSDQNTEQQLLALAKFMTGDEDTDYSVFTDDGVSSVGTKDAFDEMLKHSRAGDVICVTEISRLDRRVPKLIELYETLQARGIGITVLDAPYLSIEAGETLSTESEMMLTIMAGFARMERRIMRERTLKGTHKAQLEGKFKGKQVDQALAKRFDKLEPFDGTNKAFATAIGCSPDYIVKRRRAAKKSA